MPNIKVCKRCGAILEESDKYFTHHKRCKNGLLPVCKYCHTLETKEYTDGNKELVSTSRKAIYQDRIEEMHAMSKANYPKYAERKKEYRKVFYSNEENRIHKLEMDKKYNNEHKEELKIKNQIYRLEHKEKIHDYRIKRYYKNVKANILKTKQWGIDNPEKLQLHGIIRAQRRRERTKLLPDNFTVEEWEVCKNYFKNKNGELHCAYCNCLLEKATFEHFIPVTHGGEVSKSNIIPICLSCNSSKSNKDFFVWFPQQKFYSKQREHKILKYLNYKNGIQQLALQITG